jgi:hypothetical protein
MTSSPDSTTVAPATSTSARRRTGGHIAAIVIGGLALLPSLGGLAGGTALAVGQAVATDDDGYFTMTLDRIESDGVAVATADVWEDDLEEDGPWVFDMLDLDVRLRVDGAGPTENVFVGIARTEDVTDYLAGAPYSEVTDIDDHTPMYEQVAGTEIREGALASPLDQDIWVASASGTGEQELTWDARGGRWSVVVMNADGTADVAADVELGAHSDAITPIAVTLIVLGGLGTLVSIALIVFGVRGRRSPGTPVTSLPPPPMPEPTHPVDDHKVGI